MSAVVFAASLWAAAFVTEQDARPHVGTGSAAAAPVVAPAPAAEPVFDPASLAPLFPPGPLADAARELNEGHATAALKLLPKDLSEPPAKFVKAYALVLAGELSEGAKALEELGPRYPAMRPRIDCLAANAYAALGDLENALRHDAGCAEDPTKGKLAKIDHARMLSRLGRRDEAVAELTPLTLLTGWQRAEALFALAQVYEDAGKDALALEALRGIYLDDPTNYLAEKARTKAKELARKSKAASAPAARLADRADKLLMAGQLKAGIAQLNEITVAKLCEGACEVKRCSAASPPAAPVETKAESSIDAVASEVADAPEKAAPAATTFELAKAKDDEPALGAALPACAVETVAKPADAVACRVAMLRGIAARKTRANAKALEIERIVYERCAEPDTRARAAFTAASAASALKDADALPLATIAAFQFKDHALADDALMLAANFARDLGDRKAERAALRRLVVSCPDSDQRAEALFRLFWAHRAEGHPERGLSYLETLAREYDAGPRSDGGDAERGRYWWGRTVAQSAAAGERPSGMQMLTNLARERPMTYYGLLARSFASSIDPKWETPLPAAEAQKGFLHPGLLAQDHGFQLATELWRIGLTKDAHDALLSVDFKPLRADSRRGREATLLVLELLRDLGDDRIAHAYARRELLRTIRDATDPLARRASLVAYPLAFRGAIQEHASKAGFAPNFLQGLMREESALDPHAKSPVGARGLTQLMPATARAVAKSLGLKRFNAEKLWEPETNIEIGSVYLGRMLKTFGHPGLAAAAYNAGPGAVARWLQTASHVFDEFVEDIPFSETRGYVKRVLRSYAAYSYLYDKDNGRGVKVSLAVGVAPTGTTQDTGLLH